MSKFAFFSKRFAWKIIHIQYENPLTAVLTLEAAFDSPYEFAAGQGAWFSFPRIRGLWNARFFHFISPFADGKILEIAVRISDDWTNNIPLLREGDAAVSGAPCGSFTLALNDSPRRFFALNKTLPAPRFVFIAGGVGITPFIAMARHYAYTANERQILILWSAATHNDIILRRLFEELRYNLPQMRLIPVLTHDPLWRGETGRLNAQKLSALIPAAFGFNEDAWLWDETSASYWTNGPAGFTRDVSAALKSLGTPAKNLRKERIWSRSENLI